MTVTLVGFGQGGRCTQKVRCVPLRSGAAAGAIEAPALLTTRNPQVLGLLQGHCDQCTGTGATFWHSAV
jgi:hypothetical protein